MPPVLSNNLALVDLVDGPEVLVLPVEVDGLEDVLVEWNLGRELALVVCAVKAHFQFGQVLRVHFDHVHWFEEFLGEGQAGGLVDARERGYRLGGVVEIFIVLLHVGRVPVGYGDVVGEFGGAEDALFAEGGGAGENAFGGVGSKGLSVRKREGCG